MENGLARARPVVDDQPIPLCVQAPVFGDLFCCPEKMPHESSVVFGHTVYFGKMVVGDDEEMRRGLRVHIQEGGNQVIFVDDRRRNFSFEDFAEDAILVSAHPLFSELPEKLLKKQLLSPVWQAGPVCSTLIRSVSWSQS